MSQSLNPFVLDILAGWCNYLQSPDPDKPTYHPDYRRAVLEMYEAAAASGDVWKSTPGQWVILDDMLREFQEKFAHRTDLYIGGSGGMEYGDRLLYRIVEQLSTSDVVDAKLLKEAKDWVEYEG